MKIAIVAIVKNEASSLLEWIAYHRAVGVKDFIIIDNYSTDDTWLLLKKLRRRGLVKAFRFRTLAGKAPQLDAYQTALNRYGQNFDALAFIDADEYVTPTDGQKSVVDDVEELFGDPEVSAVALNWACYGSSGEVFRREAMVPERFTSRGMKSWSTNCQFKSIVKPDRVIRFFNPHCAWLSKGHYVDSEGNKLVANQDEEKKRFGFSQNVNWERLRINHYVVKSLEEFLVRKSKAGSAAVEGRVKHRDYFKRHDINNTEDKTLMPYMDSTRSELEEIIRKLDSPTVFETFIAWLQQLGMWAAKGCWELRRWRLYGVATIKYGSLRARRYDNDSQEKS